MSQTTPTGLHIPARDLLDVQSLIALRKTSNMWGLFLVAHAWAIIWGAMALFYVLPNPITFVLAVAIIGARQLGISILMHDAAHQALMRSPKWNDWLSDWFCAYPVFAHTGAYRRYHLAHHKRTQQPDDPDLVLSAPFPITAKSFKRKMIRDLTGQTGFRQRLAQFQTAIGESDWPLRQRLAFFWFRLGPAMLAQLVILTICALLFHWSYYIWFWALPFLTYHMAITRIRNIAEHAIIPDNNDPFRNARTTHANWLARIFLAPYWVNYHVEHHLLMYVPCYRLPALNRALLAAGYGPRMETAPHYFDIIKRACGRQDDNHLPTGGPKKDTRTEGKSRLSGSFTDGFTPNKA